MAIEEEFSIEIPDKDADGIHSSMLRQLLSAECCSLGKPCSIPLRGRRKQTANGQTVEQATEYIISQPDAS